MAALFRLHRLRFTCVAEDSVYFPPGKAANVIRGALGMTLREVCCVPECDSARTCERRGECAYARIFEPVLLNGPSGFQDPPRPFVLRAAALDGRTFAAGKPFHLDLHLFLVEDPPVAQLIRAFSRLAESGLGPSRGRVRLLDTAVAEPVTIDLLETRPVRGELVVDFLTPTELKHEGVIAERPEFAVLIARIRDRVGTLSELYGAGALELDWKGLTERAARVELLHWEPGERVRTERFSTRTKQVHPLGGITGRAIYRGDYAEFLPLLDAAGYTGVGRQTVWGKGWISVALRDSGLTSSDSA